MRRVKEQPTTFFRNMLLTEEKILIHLVRTLSDSPRSAPLSKAVSQMLLILVSCHSDILLIHISISWKYLKPVILQLLLQVRFFWKRKQKGIMKDKKKSENTSEMIKVCSRSLTTWFHQDTDNRSGSEHYEQIDYLCFAQWKKIKNVK